MRPAPANARPPRPRPPRPRRASRPPPPHARPHAPAPARRRREKGRDFRRTVFYASDWQLHRSITRYFTNMSGILSSRIVRGLLPPLVCVLLTSYCLCVYEELWTEGELEGVRGGGGLAAVHVGGPQLWAARSSCRPSAAGAGIGAGRTARAPPRRTPWRAGISPGPQSLPPPHQPYTHTPQAASTPPSRGPTSPSPPTAPSPSPPLRCPCSSCSAPTRRTTVGEGGRGRLRVGGSGLK
jgi:hypothetical protein